MRIQARVAEMKNLWSWFVRDSANATSAEGKVSPSSYDKIWLGPSAEWFRETPFGNIRGDELYRQTHTHTLTHTHTRAPSLGN